MKLFKNLSSAMKERNDVQAIKLSLKGKFPQELLDFPHLSEAYLEGDCSSLPDDLSGWKNLKILSIKWENFQGDLSNLFSLPKLENLKIIETPMKTFLLPLGAVAAPLKFLSVKNCGLEKLPEEISMLVGIEELHLPSNALVTLPYSFQELKKLKRLNLDGNKFTQFPDIVKKMNNLGHLSIDGNNFCDEEKARIQREYHIWPN